MPRTDLFLQQRILCGVSNFKRVLVAFNRNNVIKDVFIVPANKI